MKSAGWIKILSASGVFLLLMSIANQKYKTGENKDGEVHQKIIKLPEPVYKSTTSIEEALLKRRSVRDYKKASLELKEISQLLWAAQGITSEEGGRTAPSAGALYPLEVYIVCGNVKDVSPGVYHYLPSDHGMEVIDEGDKRKSLYAAALFQGAVNKAAAIIVIAADYHRTTVKYFERGKKYVHIEAGHVSQNIYLQAVSLKLGSVAIGAFTDSLVRRVVHLPNNEEPLYLMPVGKI